MRSTQSSDGNVRKVFNQASKQNEIYSHDKMLVHIIFTHINVYINVG